MARLGKESDFLVKVDDVGEFTFARRTMRDEIAVQVEYARLIDGVEPTEWLAMVCGCLAALKVLTVRAPDGWNLDELDPYDQATYAKLMLVHSALHEKELSFRRKPEPASQASGA